jgi:hypothetical protein
MYWSRYKYSLPVAVEHNRKLIQDIRSEKFEIDFKSIPEAPPLETELEIMNWLVDTVNHATDAGCFVVDLSEPGGPINVVQVVAPTLDVSPKNNKTPYTPSTRMMEHLRRCGSI